MTHPADQADAPRPGLFPVREPDVGPTVPAPPPPPPAPLAAPQPAPQPAPEPEVGAPEMGEPDLGDRVAEQATRAADAARQAGAAAAAGAAVAGENVAMATRSLSRRRSKGVRNTPNRRRLRFELAVFSIRLQGIEHRLGHQEPWMGSADALVVGAAEAVKGHQTIEAWALLWAAEREALDGLRDEELVAEGDAAVREARYLLGAEHAEAVARVARGDAAAGGDGGTNDLGARARGARDLLDRMRIELYRRLREEGRRLSGLGLLVLAFLVAAGLAVGLGVVEGGEGQVLGELDDFLAVAGIGACGAVVSMLVPWAGSNNRPAVLDFVNPTDLTVLRVATGATLAVALLVVLQVTELTAIVGAQAYPWAFFAGFGERIIDRRLDAVDAAARDAEAG